MTLFIAGGTVLVSLIAILLVVLRLRSGRARLIAVAAYAIVLVAVLAIAGWREYRSPEREYARQIDRAVADLGEKYVLFRSLGAPGSTTFNGDACDRESPRADHSYLQQTWRLLQPVDFPTLEAALERDGFETSPISNSGAVAYGFLANRDDLAIQIQSLEMGTEVRFSYGPCVPRPTIEMASTGQGPLDERTCRLYLDQRHVPLSRIVSTHRGGGAQTAHLRQPASSGIGIIRSSCLARNRP